MEKGMHLGMILITQASITANIVFRQVQSWKKNWWNTRATESPKEADYCSMHYQTNSSKAFILKQGLPQEQLTTKKYSVTSREGFQIQTLGRYDNINLQSPEYGRFSIFKHPAWQEGRWPGRLPAGNPHPSLPQTKQDHRNKCCKLVALEQSYIQSHWSTG